jgi:cardiolipin synthase
MKRPVAAAVASMLVTAISVVLVLNLTMGDDSIDRRIEHRYTAGSPQFVRVMNAMLGPGMPGGNRVEALVNGDAFFPARLDAIAGARHTLCFETYIYWSGDIGKAFAERLSARARSGVRVHVVLDWLGGGKLEQAAHESMAATS